jgi:hypothetical protein
MIKVPVIFLRVVLVLFGLGVLTLMLWVPPHEGRNAQATLFAVYFKDPFLAYAYIGSIPFFTALYQAFKVLGDFGRNEAFTPGTLKALRTMRYCALATAGIVAGAVVYVRLNAGNDDPAGFVVPGAFTVFASLVAAAGAALLENIIRKEVDFRQQKL